MTTFTEVFYGKRSATSDESIKGAFYENFTLEKCGLMLEEGDVVWDESAENNTLDDNAFKQFVEDRKGLLGYIKPMTTVYIPSVHDSALIFIETESDTLFERFLSYPIENDYEDDTEEWNVVARTGIAIWIRRKGRTIIFLEVPMKYHSINRYYEYVDADFPGAPGSKKSLSTPYFETYPISEKEDAKNLEKIMKAMFSEKYKIMTDNAFTRLSDVPAPLRAYFLRKNKRMWNAAHRIASAWSRAYWSPYTEVGKRRLARRFLE